MCPTYAVKNRISVLNTRRHEINTIFSHFSIWEMEGLVKRYFKFIWWFVKFGGEVAPDVLEFQSRLN
jgi:hypothetical protein